MNKRQKQENVQQAYILYLKSARTESDKTITQSSPPSFNATYLGAQSMKVCQ